MGKAWEKIDDFFTNPFEHPLVFWIWIVITVGGLVDGVYTGFMSAGIGGAIAYGFLGLLLGAIAGFLTAMLCAFFVAAMPFALMLLLIYGVVKLVQSLWNVGKPR